MERVAIQSKRNAIRPRHSVGLTGGAEIERLAREPADRSLLALNLILRVLAAAVAVAVILASLATANAAGGCHRAVAAAIGRAVEAEPAGRCADQGQRPMLAAHACCAIVCSLAAAPGPQIGAFFSRPAANAFERPSNITADSRAIPPPLGPPRS